MTETAVHGPVDFLLLEFREDRLTGRAAQELVNLVERGIVALYDLLVVGKSADGSVYAVELTDEGVSGAAGFTDLAWARSGLLSEEDLQEAAQAMEPGTLGVLIVYENTWAVPFVAAAMESGGELIAGARIPAPELMAALEALDARQPAEVTS
jgi:hypothetical protein